MKHLKSVKLGAISKKSAYTLQLPWAPLKARYLNIKIAVVGPFGRKATYSYIAVAVETL